MNTMARKIQGSSDPDGTQEILHQRLNTLMDHVTETHGHYLHGWEIDFIKILIRDRARQMVNGFDFVITSEPAMIICSIYNRLSLECRL